MRRSSIIGIRRKLSSGSPDSVVRSPRRNSFLQRDLFGLLHACILADKAFDLSGFATGYRIGIAGHFRPPDHLFRQVRSPLPAQIYQLRSGGLRHVRLFERPENLRNIESGQQRTAQHGQFNACGRGFRRSRHRLVDAGRPILTIPRLAIHMNRRANEGVELNPQKDLLPLMGLDQRELTDHFFLDFLSEKCRCLPEAILSWDLTVYPYEEGCRLGWHDEFVSSPRLDNLTSVLACLTGLAETAASDGLNVVALFDNEEVGSQTKQGADSHVLPDILHRIYHAFGLTDDDFSADLARAFMLSVDVAHAIHPNVPEKCDVTNQPVMGCGVALKIASSQRYAGDAAAVAVVKSLCRENDIPYQVFMNRSDIPGGSTLGSLLSANLPLRAMDIGIPITAMHSCRELMGAADQESLVRLIRAFFSHK